MNNTSFLLCSVLVAILFGSLQSDAFRCFLYKDGVSKTGACVPPQLCIGKRQSSQGCPIQGVVCCDREVPRCSGTEINDKPNDFDDDEEDERDADYYRFYGKRGVRRRGFRKRRFGADWRGRRSDGRRKSRGSEFPWGRKRRPSNTSGYCLLKSLCREGNIIGSCGNAPNFIVCCRNGPPSL